MTSETNFEKYVTQNRTLTLPKELSYDEAFRQITQTTTRNLYKLLREDAEWMEVKGRKRIETLENPATPQSIDGIPTIVYVGRDMLFIAHRENAKNWIASKWLPLFLNMVPDIGVFSEAA